MVHDVGLLRDIALGIVFAAILGHVARLIRQPLLLGYIAAGIALSPQMGFGLVTSAENIGVLVRNCVAFGAHGLVVGETSASPFLRRAVRNSMGTIFQLPIIETRNLAGSITEMRQWGIRCIAAHPHTDRFLADPTILWIIDSIGIELIHPRREGRSSTALGRKGISNHRWIVGIKLAWLINQRGEVVEWQWLPANVNDQEFRDVVDWQEDQTIGLADQGFRLRAGGCGKEQIYVALFQKVLQKPDGVGPM